jgi:rhodanese-related sulfurtransferase
MKKKSTSGEFVLILVMGCTLGVLYNAFSPKPIPLIPKTVEKVSVSDASLFPNGDAGSVTDVKGHSDVKVIAPLHERALKHPDSVAAIMPHQEGKETTRIVTLEQFRRLMKEAKPLIIDGRDSTAYLKGHVKGARNIYGLEVDQYFERLALLPKDTLVIVYCNNPECHLGRMVAEFMGMIGFTKIYLYDDGWDGWEKARQPIDSVAVPW